MLGFLAIQSEAWKFLPNYGIRELKVSLNKIANNKFFKVTRPSYFVRVPSYFLALWYPQLYFDRKSNI